ncbi:hypothetical protein K466DRAFT_257626 [Polyporus arcularius HHB13444]|uniref:F-box domain-containing protein n=1 Tax=Polyporus arcularius HHB13444 TaxID=1314778 RepID=A0A5C3P1R6_9APHY|nr:hypothetical protein K466DRAFT_257626 [Polyporus arcularius HHB13444]
MMSDSTIVLTVGLPESENVEDVLTAGDISLACIPHLEPLVAALIAVGASHKPVVLRYRANAPFVLSYVECRLQDASHVPLLQHVLSIPTLVALQLHLPAFGPEALPVLYAPSLTAVVLRGELPCTYQFLHAMRASSLEKLQIFFHRNQWDKLNTLDESLRDHAYMLALAPTSFPVLRTVRVEEVELHPRWSDVSFGCAIRPLMHIPTLEDVEVQLDASPLWVSVDDLARVAVVWSDLRRLVLTCKTAAKRAPTVDALSHLEAACRNLVELVLPKIRLQEPESLGAHPGRLIDAPVGNHPLRTLHLPCQTARTVSSEYCWELGWQIEQLFPYLEPDTEDACITRPASLFSDWDMIRKGILDAKAAKSIHIMSML